MLVQVHISVIFSFIKIMILFVLRLAKRHISSILIIAYRNPCSHYAIFIINISRCYHSIVPSRMIKVTFDSQQCTFYTFCVAAAVWKLFHDALKFSLGNSSRDMLHLRSNIWKDANKCYWELTNVSMKQIGHSFGLLSAIFVYCFNIYFKRSGLFLFSFFVILNKDISLPNVLCFMAYFDYDVTFFFLSKINYFRFNPVEWITELQHRI